MSLTMIINESKRELYDYVAPEERRAAQYTLKQELPAGPEDINEEGLVDVLESIGLQASRIKNRIIKANTEFGIEYGFNDYKYMPEEKIKKGHSHIWVQLGEDRIGLQILSSLSNRIKKDKEVELFLYANIILDTVTRYATNIDNYDVKN